MTEETWWDHHSVLMNEMQTASDSFHTWKGINDQAAANPDVLRQMQTNPSFWNLTLHGLQTTFVITIGRAFDTNKKSNSIQNLLSEMVAHPEYFSKQALERRKRDQVNGGNPGWLQSYMNAAWEPSKIDLEQLRDGMQPVVDKYKRAYKPVRDKIFAHLDIGVNIQMLLSQTLISEVEDILYAVRDTLECVSSIYLNGLRPRLGVRNYENVDLGTETRRLLNGLQAAEEA